MFILPIKSRRANNGVAGSAYVGFINTCSVSRGWADDFCAVVHHAPHGAAKASPNVPRGDKRVISERFVERQGSGGGVRPEKLFESFLDG